MKRFILVFIPLLLFLPQYSFAHIGGHGHISGFWAGISHPVLGLDHLLAMVSVGIISAQIAGRAIWIIPLTFVIVMAIGGAFGMMDIGLFAIEPGIALSVIMLGLAITQGKKIAMKFILAMVAFFAIFHGYAHGLEIPQFASSWLYIIGFMLGTAILHILGVLIGIFANKFNNGATILSYSGAVIAGMGLHIILAIYGL
ncbi:MAG: HupE/UreJ family protein [Pseudomonadota bacterium]